MKYLVAFILFITVLPSYAQHDVPVTSEFEVSGAVKNKVKFSIKDLSAFKQDSVGDVVLRNHRGDQKSVAKQMKGILLKTILDSANIVADKPKEYSEFVIKLIASDGYTNVYSWNELYNTDIGNHVYIITEMDGEHIDKMDSRILALSLSDTNSGRRHLKGLAKIEVKKVQ